jgi:hypothetical protein
MAWGEGKQERVGEEIRTSQITTQRVYNSGSPSAHLHEGIESTTRAITLHSRDIQKNSRDSQLAYGRHQEV